MTTQVVVRPEESRALEITKQANELVITNQAQRLEADTMAQALKELGEKIFAYLDPPRAQAYEVYQSHKKRLDEKFNPIEAARKTVKQKAFAWDKEQEAKRLAEVARLQAEANAKAELERKRAAVAAEIAGREKEAEEILSKPVETPKVEIPKAKAPSAATRGRDVWSAEVTDRKAFAKAVAEDVIPSEAVEGNMTFINFHAREKKSGLNWPGVTVSCKTV